MQNKLKKFDEHIIIISNATKDVNRNTPIKMVIISYNNRMAAPTIVFKEGSKTKSYNDIKNNKDNKKYQDLKNDEFYNETKKKLNNIDEDKLFINNHYLCKKLYNDSKVNEEINKKYYKKIAILYLILYEYNMAIKEKEKCHE